MTLTDEIIKDIAVFVRGAMLEDNKRLRPIPHNCIVNNGHAVVGGSVIGKILTPYKSGTKLVQLFNDFNSNDEALPEGMSRETYTLERLQQINGTQNMKLLVEDLFFPRTYEREGLSVSDAVTWANQSLKYCGFELVGKDDVYKLSGDGLAEPELVEVKPVFEDIQAEILAVISEAKYMIWVAVAWFTDEIIFAKLIEKKSEGINIQIIVCNDEITKKHSLPYEQYFECYRINEFGAYENNILHDKFCIIDLSIVMHGSYNWTKKAAYNFEDITTTKSRDCASVYANRFIELKKIGMRQ